MSYTESSRSRSHSHSSATGDNATAAAGAAAAGGAGNSNADPASVTATLVDDEEYVADRADRTGLPVIPRGAPPAGDTIDLAGIQREYANRAVRRSSPLAAPHSVPLRSIATSERQQQQQQQQQQQEEDEFEEFRYEAPERRSIRQKLPKKTFFTAAFLLGVGVIFSVLGLSFVFTLGLSEALPFLIIGGIGFIPGSYVSFIIYQTWKGVPGYSYDQIPSYDD